MDRERWQEIETLYNSALERPPGERGAFLSGACRGDEDLCREVESLLNQENRDGFLDRPAWQGVADVLGEGGQGQLPAGAQIGPYRIEAVVGVGGMGTVYKARDTRLRRVVAIKVSKADFDRRAEMEARAVAALNHPHICTLYDVGPNYLVMEYVEGKSPQGPMPIAEALRLAVQIAGALDAAHHQGIVHRDLKPSNILVTRSGVKLLDFGLAKARCLAGAAGEEEKAPEAITAEGTIVGTPQYMSPEQVQGLQTDARSDIFSFGCVLYEMITGRRAFEGRNAASVSAAIVAAEPPQLSSLQPLIPAALDRLIRTCLAKDPDQRWQSARDLKLALEWIAEAGRADSPAPGRRVVGWIAAGVALTVAGGFAGWRLLSRDRPMPVRFTIQPPEKVKVGPWSRPVLSPDGRRLFFFGTGPDGQRRLWLRSLNSTVSEPIPGTEAATAVGFWSRDSRSIAFVAGGELKELKRVDLDDGGVRTLCSLSFVGMPNGCWNRDGVILIGPPLQRLPAQGGAPRALMAPQRAIAPLEFLPDQRRFLYWDVGRAGDPIGIASLDGSEDMHLPLSAWLVAYVPPYLLYPSNRGSLLAQRFDPARGNFSGEATAVATNVARTPFVGFSASRNGVLAWRAGSGVGLSRLVWVDRTGKELQTVGTPDEYTNPALSPDGKRLAVGIGPFSVERDIWIVDLVRGSRTRFTLDPGDDGTPVWSPDGSQIVWTSNRTGTQDLYIKAANGAGEDKLLRRSDRPEFADDWSADGRFLLFRTRGVGIRILPMGVGGGAKPQFLIERPYVYLQARIAPNGKFFAYSSEESGRSEVYVQDLPPAGRRIQISSDGGQQPFWKRDGTELYFVSRDHMMAVAVKTSGAAFEAGVPQPLFPASLSTRSYRNTYAAAPDGRRFLLNLPVEERDDAMTVLLNWQAVLER